MLRSARRRLRLRLLGALLAAGLAALPAASAHADGSPFPLPPDELEALLAAAPFEIREHEWVAGWRHAVYRVEAFFPSLERTLELKWKPATAELETRNNTPRREVAAYAIQKWFLGPERYVVPTTVARCLPFETLRALDPDARPNVPEARCTIGSLAIWLQHVEPPDPLLDLERFHTDAVYATHLAHYNLLTYLIDNVDTRAANVLVSDDDERRVFSIDNGVSFGAPLYNFFRSHWNALRVPALPETAIARLREVGEPQLRALATVVELEVGTGGAARAVAPSEPFDADAGVRRRDGRIQLGLTGDEIAGVRQRLHELLERVDAGEIRLF